MLKIKALARILWQILSSKTHKYRQRLEFYNDGQCKK